MTIDEQVLLFINCMNELNFKRGGIAYPKFKSLDEIDEFNEAMSKIFPPVPDGTKFRDCEGLESAIQFDIPQRYKYDTKTKETAPRKP